MRLPIFFPPADIRNKHPGPHYIREASPGLFQNPGDFLQDKFRLLIRRISTNQFTVFIHRHCARYFNHIAYLYRPAVSYDIFPFRTR